MDKNRVPIRNHAGDIVNGIEQHQCLIVAGATGCGKTTELPYYLWDAKICPPHLMIGVTEPRRIAAISVASYVAQKHDLEVGGLIGYQIRHRSCTSDETHIKYMTEGILLRELLADPDLTRYGCIVLDEVHERGVNSDLLMALIKQLMVRRPDLKVVIMSATIDEDRFAEYFNAPIIRVGGRTYPVTFEYADETPNDYVGAAATKTAELLGRTPGDVLVFLPDYRGLRDCAEELTRLKVEATLHMLYGNQAPEEQMAVFNRTGRSIILATNVAETSVTLDGVTAVVDTGKIKEYRYSPEKGMATLKVVDHSQAGCTQRAGRAGRTQPGLCCRLYSSEDFEDRPVFTDPEILRVSLDQTLLQLKAMNFSDENIRNFDFLDPPNRKWWKEAAASLELLGATDRKGKLTEDGRLMADIPLPPQMTKMLVAAKRLGCIKPIITVVASFSTRPVFTRPPGQEDAADEVHADWHNPSSDFLTLLRVVNTWRNSLDRDEFCAVNYCHRDALKEIEDVERQITGMLEERQWTISECRRPDAIGQAVTAGLIANLMVREGRRFRSCRRDGIRIHPGSSLASEKADCHAEYLACAEIVETTGVYARQIQTVKHEWIRHLPIELRPQPAHEKKSSHRHDKHHEQKHKRDRHGRRHH